jgi:hypothetical protein
LSLGLQGYQVESLRGVERKIMSFLIPTTTSFKPRSDQGESTPNQFISSM